MMMQLNYYLFQFTLATFSLESLILLSSKSKHFRNLATFNFLDIKLFMIPSQDNISFLMKLSICTNMLSKYIETLLEDSHEICVR